MGVILTLLAAVVEYLGVATLIDFFTTGFPRFRRSGKKAPEQYLITKQNRMDLQSGPSCSGYSAAYVLRHLGIGAKGDELYQIMPGKMKKGAVYPKGVVKLLNQKMQNHEFPDGKKYRAEYCCGSLEQLKWEISHGVPVIVFVKTQLGKRWLHFIPVVGYDQEYFYIAESLQSIRNAHELHYSRKVPVEEFRKLWNTMMLQIPLYRNTYIVVREVNQAERQNRK